MRENEVKNSWKKEELGFEEGLQRRWGKIFQFGRQKRCGSLV